jgi:hypothetical protein
VGVVFVLFQPEAWTRGFVEQGVETVANGQIAAHSHPRAGSR